MKRAAYKTLSAVFKAATVPFNLVCILLQLIGAILAMPFAWVHDRFLNIHMRCELRAAIADKKRWGGEE